ncbi:hypothetical protein EB118_03050 [bacterium]|nr:hypothetical protein [bacterium]
MVVSSIFVVICMYYYVHDVIVSVVSFTGIMLWMVVLGYGIESMSSTFIDTQVISLTLVTLNVLCCYALLYKSVSNMSRTNTISPV